LEAPIQIGRGGFSNVFKVRIAEGHLKVEKGGYVEVSCISRPVIVITLTYTRIRGAG
jgi:hypothetical protein